MDKNFGSQLKLLIQQRNLSASGLAQEIGVSPKTVLEWLGGNGRMPRSAEHIKAMAKFFGVSTHTLLFGEEDPRSLIGEILEKSEIHTGLYEITIKKVKTNEGKK